MRRKGFFIQGLGLLFWSFLVWRTRRFRSFLIVKCKNFPENPLPRQRNIILFRKDTQIILKAKKSPPLRKRFLPLLIFSQSLIKNCKNIWLLYLGIVFILESWQSILKLMSLSGGMNEPGSVILNWFQFCNN